MVHKVLNLKENILSYVYKSNKLNVTQEQKSAKTTIKALSQTQISNFGSEIESDNEYDNTDSLRN